MNVVSRRRQNLQLEQLQDNSFSLHRWKKITDANAAGKTLGKAEKNIQQAMPARPISPSRRCRQGNGNGRVYAANRVVVLFITTLLLTRPASEGPATCVVSQSSV